MSTDWPSPLPPLGWTNQTHQKVHIEAIRKALHYVKKLEKLDDKQRELDARGSKEKERTSLKVKRDRVG